MADKTYVGEEGKPLKLDAGENISAATAQSIAVRKPDGTVDSWDALVVDSNFVQHVSGSGDFDQDGTYRVQAVVTIGGLERQGNTARFTIFQTFG